VRSWSGYLVCKVIRCPTKRAPNFLFVVLDCYTGIVALIGLRSALTDGYQI
jgi:hypothetical protein